MTRDIESPPSQRAAAPADQGLAARALAVLHAEGPRVFWIKLLSGLGVYRRLFLLERSLADPIDETASAVRLDIDLLTRDDVDECLALRPDSVRSTIVELLEAGSLCFVARHDGRAVGTCWVAPDRPYTAFLDWELPLSAGDAYLFDAYTLPTYRGQRIAPAICAHQLRYCRDAGFRRAMRATSPENVSALRAHAKSGFRQVGVVGRVKLGPWRRYFAHGFDR